MKRFVIAILLLMVLTIPADASAWTIPQVTGEASQWMPQEDSEFTDGLLYIIKGVAANILPALTDCLRICASILASCVLLSVVNSVDAANKGAVHLCSVVCIALLLLKPANTMISLAAETVQALSEYNKLILPVLSAILSAQGGTTSSTTLYTASVAFDAMLSWITASVVLPLIYIYLALMVVKNAIADDALKAFTGSIKAAISWILKMSLYAFTGYISISGVISGSVDAAAVKATKLTISSAVPVIGSILADASESLLLSVSVIKNAVGIYGLLAVVAISAMPFIRIGIQYCLVKVTGAICAMFSDKYIKEIMEDYCNAMAMLLGLTGTMSVMMIISLVCFLKGMG